MDLVQQATGNMQTAHLLRRPLPCREVRFEVRQVGQRWGEKYKRNQLRNRLTPILAAGAQEWWPFLPRVSLWGFP